MKKKTVLIIFKTHLDIGFTDYAANVVNNYITNFIPNAIKLGYELKDTDTPFVWTVGSWMIDKVLQEDKTGAVEQAIRDGILNWHGLPFTSHTELMSPELFQYGLHISTKLDQRFGRRTIGAKMTDVPGHTKGMIPYMCQAGLKFLHIGVNPATPIPPVPPLFRWRCGKESLVVMYQNDYGEYQDFGDFGVYFAHTKDNKGPQSKEKIIEIYETLKQKFPDCELRAGTLNDLAEYACNIQYLPVLTGEIGDVWIHGVGTDPQKLSRYRKILRELPKADLTKKDLTDNLLLVPEHTWGANLDIYFHNDKDYSHTEMEKTEFSRTVMEGSWEEQREYVRAAERLLNITPDYPIAEPKLDGYTACEAQAPDFEISWQIFDNSDYERYKQQYLKLTDKNASWALWDNVKVGLPNYKGGIYTAHVTKSCKCKDKMLYRLEFDADIKERYGLPYFYAEAEGDFLTLKWFGKKCSRYPQACWLKLHGLKEAWELDKLGEWINPCSVVGSPLIAAINSGVRNEDVMVECLDSALVAPFGRKLLHYGEDHREQDLYFNLYNNIWNTNFPMWYSDDALFRFRMTLYSKK